MCAGIYRNTTWKAEVNYIHSCSMAETHPTILSGKKHFPHPCQIPTTILVTFCQELGFTINYKPTFPSFQVLSESVP